MGRGPGARFSSVFINHSSQHPDHTITKSLADALQTVGFDVWWNKEGLEGGDFFPVEILEAIIRQRHFILVVSPRSIASKWCQRELIRATELAKDIKPLILERVPDGELTLALAGMHCTSISQGTEKAMPTILKELGVGDSAQIQLQPDPFIHDGLLIQAIADALQHPLAFTDGLGGAPVLHDWGHGRARRDGLRTALQADFRSTHSMAAVSVVRPGVRLRMGAGRRAGGVGDRECC